MRPGFLLSFFLFVSIITEAQDTLRYEYSFKLPVRSTQQSYQKKISQYPTEVHSFILQVPDSCTAFIVIRSAYDDLAIVMDDGTIIEKATKEGSLHVYSDMQEMHTGKRSFMIRTRAYCSYTVNVSGSSLR